LRSVATARELPGIPLYRWSSARGSTPGLFTPATRAEADFIRGAATVAAADSLARKGFSPDVIVAHPGWGESLFLKEIWPNARMLLVGELIYSTSGGDVNFDPEFGQADLDEKVRVHAKNASQLLAFAFADLIICPTAFQAAAFPASLQPNLRIVHKGIDVSLAKTRSKDRISFASGDTVIGADGVITYVSRTLEPQRGFHIFLRALPDVLKACPKAQVVIVGDDRRRGYGPAPKGGRTWKNVLLEELGDDLDLARVHFTGNIAHRDLIDVFSVSSVHVYYTYPFVLSWSLLEAMACECLVIASDTPPVRDAIRNGKEGILLPFLHVESLSKALVDVLKKPDGFEPLRKQGRARVVADFGAEAATGSWLAAIDELLPVSPAPGSGVP
jgi:glycosyltransferase involved in cell wall biosynthesis